MDSENKISAMKLLMIIDSMELNGGSSMFLEMIAGLKKYYPEYNVTPLVVSKTGYYGRDRVVNNDLMLSYGSNVPSMNYEMFETKKYEYCTKDTIVVHHRLGCTRPLKVPCPYVVINHTVQSPQRMKKFRHAQAVVSVCAYISIISDRYVKSSVILNGVDNEYDNLPAYPLEGKFKTGRCHRLAGAKFNEKSLSFLDTLPMPEHKHYLIGPTEINKARLNKHESTRYLGVIFNKRRKMSIINQLDVYFYDANMREGASMAILEALSCGVPVVCRPRGGNSELVRNEINGFHFRQNSEAADILLRLYNDHSYLKTIRKQTIKDFDRRLHIRHMLDAYVKIFRRLSE